MFCAAVLIDNRKVVPGAERNVTYHNGELSQNGALRDECPLPPARPQTVLALDVRCKMCIATRY